MTTPAILFREIHRLRRNIRDLQDQIERAPRQLKIQQGKVAHQEQLHREGQETLKKLKITTLEKESELKAAHALVNKHLKQMETAEGKKEYDALQLEIKNERAQAARLEDEILAAMGETEERTANLPVLDQNVKKARADFAEWEKGAGDRLADLQKQLTDAQTQLKTAEADLPRALLPAYNRLINAMGADALSQMNGRTCVACSTEITAQNNNDLLIGNFVSCKACGRILYLPE
jgi:predicted  nucleic acid-binding Zn-ribbon protein